MSLMVKKLFNFGAVTALVLLSVGTSALAFGRDSFGTGSFGGELRGATRLTGKVICTACTVNEVQRAAAEHLPDLYVFKNGTQQAVFQVTTVGNTASGQEASQLGYWQAITGLTKQVNVRAEESLWRKLTAVENVRKEVELNGLLRSTGTFDMAEVDFVDAGE